MRRITQFIKNLLDKINVVAAAFILGTLGISLIAIGFIYVRSDDLNFKTFAEDLYANGGAELISIAVTVLVIERLNERRAVQREKDDLILQMGSPDNTFAREAIRKLRSRGWLNDGSLEWSYIEGANLQKTNLENAHMAHSRLKKVDLRESNLGRTDLFQANLQDSNLYKADLSGTDIQHAYLQGANISYANLQRAKLQGSRLDNANLTGAELFSADLTEAILLNAILIDADLTLACLHKTNLQNANLQEANLESCEMHESTLEGADLTNARFSDYTILPDGTKWRSNVDMERFTDINHPNFWEPEWLKSRKQYYRAMNQFINQAMSRSNNTNKNRH